MNRFFVFLFVGVLLAPSEGAWASSAVDENDVSDDTSEFISLFDGETLDGWSGEPAFWRVEDGHIVAETTAENRTPVNTFLVWEGGEVYDFELILRYKVDTEWANSGVQIRSERFDDYRVRGYQIDIATEDWITGIFYEEGGRSVLARRGQTLRIGADGAKETSRFADEDELARHINANEWNEYHIIARGNHFVAHLNGNKMHDVVDNGPEARANGILAFQLHAGAPMRIRFTDIMLKPLSRR